MSDHNHGSSWKSVALNTAVAGGAFVLGFIVDKAIESLTKTKSNVGTTAAAWILGAMHLNEAMNLMSKWNNSDTNA
ncbi:MAG: hypothetical protein EAY65_04950 [Alphaproteobacteria bacterium]|nr:MAG: hypothetical protein EAY65_04950 [Alphaproteobacteria bacterium]